MKKTGLYVLWCFLFGLGFFTARAQTSVIVNLAPVDGIDITPDNILNFQVILNREQSTRALIKGSIVYRRSDLRISYQFAYTLQPGLNIIPAQSVQPQYTYSSTGLKELFEYHKRLPQGIYEYCVSVQPDYTSVEGDKEVYNECTYHKAEDIFLINLLDPQNDARIYEYQPMLSWTVNYPFASELTYRIRVAEMREGQNAAGAVSRNPAVWEERNLSQLSIMYPAYAKPLQVFKTYAWTVDAYYKGILLGGAEPWKFTIVEDSLLSARPVDPAFADIAKESGHYALYAPGLLKLKYKLEDLKRDTLSLTLTDDDGKEIKLKTNKLEAVYGDNRYVLEFYKDQPLKHGRRYTLHATSITGHTYRILFRYANPELIK